MENGGSEKQQGETGRRKTAAPNTPERNQRRKPQSSPAKTPSTQRRQGKGARVGNSPATHRSQKAAENIARDDAAAMEGDHTRDASADRRFRHGIYGTLDRGNRRDGGSLLSLSSSGMFRGTCGAIGTTRFTHVWTTRRPRPSLSCSAEYNGMCRRYETQLNDGPCLASPSLSSRLEHRRPKPMFMVLSRGWKL